MGLYRAGTRSALVFTGAPNYLPLCYGRKAIILAAFYNGRSEMRRMLEMTW